MISAIPQKYLISFKIHYDFYKRTNFFKMLMQISTIPVCRLNEIKHRK
jgi:hypothetical protein